MNSALYWTKEEGNLVNLIEECDAFNKKEFFELGKRSKYRIIDVYSWAYISKKYENLLV